MPDAADPVFFENGAAFRTWLSEHHASVAAIVVGFPKVGSGISGITYQEALDAALAYGWIDDVRKRIDDTRWQIRFSPRKSTSIWSAVNLKRVEELIAAGAMETPGLAVHANRNPNRERIYAYENRPRQLPRELESEFRREAAAWTWFQTQAAGYQKALIWWVVSAKREATQRTRLQALIEASKEQRLLR